MIFIVPECMLALDEKETCLFVVDGFYLTKVAPASGFYLFYCEVRPRLFGCMLGMFNHITTNNIITKDEYVILMNLKQNSIRYLKMMRLILSGLNIQVKNGLFSRISDHYLKLLLKLNERKSNSPGMP